MASARSDDGKANGGWRHWLARLIGLGSEPSLREQIADAIDEAEEDAAAIESEGGDGELARAERDMLRNMLRFGSLTADDIAVPRADIVAIPESASMADAIALFSEADHSRLPVYRDALDNVVGMLHVKDLFRLMAQGGKRAGRIADKKGLIRQPLFVPQSMPASRLLSEMQAARVHLAIILDEYGGTEGLVTIEDLVEQIVGDIEDEYDDAPEILLHLRDDGGWDADARAELSDVAEQVDGALIDPDDDVDTLGGLAVVLAGHVPAVGEVIGHPSGWTMTVTAGDERRVARLLLTPPSTPA